MLYKYTTFHYKSTRLILYYSCVNHVFFLHNLVFCIIYFVFFLNFHDLEQLLEHI